LTEPRDVPEAYGQDAEPIIGEPQKGGGYLVRAEAVYVRQGPLPNAEEMERYEQVLSGSADRILVMAEKEVEHRHRMDKRGQLLGAALPAFFIVLGAIIFVITGSWAGVAFAGLGLTPAGYNFLRGISRRTGQTNGD
jgi:uncharacterized membrane protein